MTTVTMVTMNKRWYVSTWLCLADVIFTGLLAQGFNTAGANACGANAIQFKSFHDSLSMFQKKIL